MTWLKRICLDTIQQLRMYMQTVKNIDIVFLKQCEIILPIVLVYQTFLRSLLPMIQQSFVDWHQKWGNGSLLLRLLLFRSLLEIAFFLLLLPLLSLFKLFLEEAAAVANERRRVFSNSYFFFWGGEELLLRLYPTLRKLAWAQKRDLVLLRRKTAKLITWHEEQNVEMYSAAPF